MDAIETIERDGYVGEIHVDECPFNPREDYDAPGSLLVQLSDRHLAPSKADERDWRYDAIQRAWERGRSISRYSRVRHDPELVERYARAFLGAAAVAWWDDPYGSSRVVCIIDRDSDFTDPARAAESILAEYAAWCVGEVYGYTVTDPDGEVIDSCWGYYGDGELPYVRTCINDAIGAGLREQHAERAAMFKRLVDGAA